MSLTPEEIKQQTRQLWETCFNDSDGFLDIYFREKYTDGHNITLRDGDTIKAAMQLLPYRFTCHETVLHAGYISGLCVHPEQRRKGLAAQLLQEAHCRLYAQGGTISFLIPGHDGLRHFYEKPEHGAYWTTTFRTEVELTETEDTEIEPVKISLHKEWQHELYTFFSTHSQRDFMLHPSEKDFFAALAAIDLEGGYVLVARRGQHIVGLCLAITENDNRLFVRSLLVLDNAVRNCFIRWFKSHTATVHARIPVPGTMSEACPYAMARIVNAERFLAAIAHTHPDIRLHIGVEGDKHIPENNRFYLIANGEVNITERKPENIVTPGELATMFLGAYPIYAEMLLDE